MYANDSAQSLRLVDFSKAVNLYGRDAHFDTLIGQPEHIAPETMTIHSTQKQAIYSKATDVWQAGCILYVLLHAKLPFGNQNDIIQQQNLESRICNGLFIDTVNTLGVSDEAKNLLQRMLAVNPSERISTAEVLKHPWIANNDSLPKEKFNSEYLSRLKLMVGNAFTNSTSTSMQATQTPATEKVQSPIALTPGTRMFQVVCPGLKIPVRNEPNPSSSILTYLTSGAVVYVMCKAQSGYYQLADQPVSYISIFE